MTDRQLAEALTQAEGLEQTARAACAAAGEDVVERDAALVTVRLIVPVQQALTRWTTLRARRAAAGNS